MLWLVSAHIIPQWLVNDAFPIYIILWNILESIGACAFLFTSGISSFISFKKREQNKGESILSTKRSRNEYYFRAIIIFLIGFIVNIILAIYNNSWLWIFAWDFLQSVSICLILAWPLYKKSILVRLNVAILFWIINEIILYFIRPHKGETPSLLFILLYTTEQFDSVLWFFTFFLVGTIIGELIFIYNSIENLEEKREYLKNKILKPCLNIGLVLMIFGILLEFPDITNDHVWAQIRSLPWRIYALGFDIFLIALLLLIEEYEIIKLKKNYRFLFYFSYYSFTVYGSHYILTLLFFRRFNVDLSFFITLFITLILYGLLLNILYKTLGSKVSIKVQISRISSGLAEIIEERKKNEMRL